MCVWFSPPQEIIKCQGLDPLAFEYIVLKSAVHYRGDFTELSSHIVEVTGPGKRNADELSYKFRLGVVVVWKRFKSQAGCFGSGFGSGFR